MEVWHYLLYSSWTLGDYFLSFYISDFPTFLLKNINYFYNIKSPYSKIYCGFLGQVRGRGDSVHLVGAVAAPGSVLLFSAALSFPSRSPLFLSAPFSVHRSASLTFLLYRCSSTYDGVTSP